MIPDNLRAAMQRAVVSFEADATDQYENTVTGRRMTSGLIAFDCGHSYKWYPWGLADHEPMPAPGAAMGCADCIQEILDAAKAARAAQHLVETQPCCVVRS